MSDRLPRDREKALEAIASGSYSGRQATRAHPLCKCADPVPRPSFLPPCTRCGAEKNEKCRQPGPVCGPTSHKRYWRRVDEHMAGAVCPVH